MKINTLRLRAMIGWLGMLLPWIVAGIYIAIGKGFPPSISATWFERAICTPFMIILGSASLLLMSYKGYEIIDDILLTCAGIAGLLICLFPCAAEGGKIGMFMVESSISGTIHNISAIIFFGLLAYNSFFLFTKGAAKKTKKKKARDIIYRICGVGMIGSFALLLLPSFPSRIWLVEAVALFFFGVSFLTKADIYPFLFCDTPFTDGEGE